MNSDLTTTQTKTVANGNVHPVVCIGASAGGMEALHQLFDNLPENTGFAFIVIQHLSPDHKSLAAELLAKHTTMPVTEARAGVCVEPNSVYVIPNNRNIIIRNRELILQEKDGRTPNMAIDIFLRSLASDAGDKAIAIILSGTGTDGSQGIEEIQNAGGLVFVQDPNSARFDGMPLNAIASGKIDYILSPESIAEELVARYKVPTKMVIVDSLPESDEVYLQEIFSILQAETSCDFEQYKRPTVIRRLTRRMALINCQTLPAYIEVLQKQPGEIDILVREFLIGVTRFFRDEEAFSELETQVIPHLFEGRHKDDSIKVWVPGCSTGEEAYTIAILMAEAVAKNGKDLDVKIFASDINKKAIEFASRGIYPESISSHLTREYLDRYFVHTNQQYRVSQPLRRTVIFSHHDILKHPPFGKLDLVSCRNMLIYLSAPLQKRVLQTFHFALNAGGYLMLGPSENITEYREYFSDINKKWRIFKKNQDGNLPRLETSGYGGDIGRRYMPNEIIQVKGSGRKAPPETLLHHLVDACSLAGVMVDAECNIVESFGNYRRYIQLPEKKFDLNLLKMLPPRASVMVGTAFRRVIASGEKEVLPGVWFTPEQFMVDVTLTLLRDHRPQAILIIFSDERKVMTPALKQPVLSPDASEKRESPLPDVQDFLQLQEELRDVRETLQHTVEQAETMNEELQSANEELISANEELQSANEELQSLNEELHTLNAENQLKIREVTELNDDLNNYFRTTPIGKVFLDRNLAIRKFTPAVTTLINLIDSDVGRPITHISNVIPLPQLTDEISKVIATSNPVQHELELPNETHFLLRILPYLREEKHVDGAVLIFVDVSAVKRAEKELARSNQALSDMNEHLLRSNRELEQFAYITSHDLQEPLRKIQTFADLIGREPGKVDNVTRYLGKISNAAVRMSVLIKDVLSYSRLTLSREEARPVDLNGIIQAVLEDFELLIEQKNAKIRLTQLQPVEGVPLQLHQLFMNLISNSLKFCERDPEVTIHSERVDDTVRDQLPELNKNIPYIRVTLSDNGIGFEQQYSAKIFTIFQRLNHRKEYAGTGIGLALCKRIVENHHGTIYAHSTPGYGTTFAIYLPAA